MSLLAGIYSTANTADNNRYSNLKKEHTEITLYTIPESAEEELFGSSHKFMVKHQRGRRPTIEEIKFCAFNHFYSQYRQRIRLCDEFEKSLLLSSKEYHNIFFIQNNDESEKVVRLRTVPESKESKIFGSMPMLEVDNNQQITNLEVLFTVNKKLGSLLAVNGLNNHELNLYSPNGIKKPHEKFSSYNTFLHINKQISSEKNE